MRDEWVRIEQAWANHNSRGFVNSGTRSTAYMDGTIRDNGWLRDMYEVWPGNQDIRWFIARRRKETQVIYIRRTLLA